MALQNLHVTTLTRKLASAAPVRSLARVELHTLRGMVSARIDTAEDWKVRAHLMDVKAEIEKALEGGAPAPAAPATTGGGRRPPGG